MKSQVHDPEDLPRGSKYGKEEQHTFFTVLHRVPRNSAVPGAGWGQPAEDDRGAASLLSYGPVGGCGNTCGDRQQGGAASQNSVHTIVAQSTGNMPNLPQKWRITLSK